MGDNLGPILIGLAAILMTVVIWSIARRIFLGQLVPVEVQQLLTTREEEVRLLRQQLDVLREERDGEKAQLRQMVKESTEAINASTIFLNRYEQLGGFASGPQIKRKGPEATE